MTRWERFRGDLVDMVATGRSAANDLIHPSEAIGVGQYLAVSVDNPEHADRLGSSPVIHRVRSGSKRRSPGSSPTGRRRVISRALTSSLNVILRDEDMDRDEALKLLKSGEEGIREWNQRRRADEAIPDLSGADLRRAYLSGADLSSANLRRAILNTADLHHAILRGADLVRADLFGADLSSANLRRAILNTADLHHAILNTADLSGADLSHAKLSHADLRHAILSGANLSGANLSHAKLSDADFNGGSCWGTFFANVDLSEVKGLESIKHQGPSTVGIDTLFRSHGKIPEGFLRDCGVPDTLIARLPSIMGAMQPIQFYSCFISYSTANEEFAGRLRNDFLAAGINCWKWDQDARTGRSLWGEIDEAIQEFDKLVLIASEFSLKSPAVIREIERAIVQEDERSKLKSKGKKKIEIDVLFPVTLDDYIFTKWKHERKVDVTRKVIADARGWDSDAKVYANVRDKLIRDLKAEGSTKAKRV